MDTRIAATGTRTMAKTLAAFIEKEKRQNAPPETIAQMERTRAEWMDIADKYAGVDAGAGGSKDVDVGVVAGSPAESGYVNRSSRTSKSTRTENQTTRKEQQHFADASTEFAHSPMQGRGGINSAAEETAAGMSLERTCAAEPGAA